MTPKTDSAAKNLPCFLTAILMAISPISSAAMHNPSHHRPASEESTHPAPKSTPEISCSTTREFITTLEYLRSHPEFAVPEKDARKLADQVAQACTGSAGRFIKIMGVLTQAQMATSDALKIGLEFTHRTDVETATFISVFLQAFARDSLDLDLQSSVELARSLTTEFRGDIQSVMKDWETLIQFCVHGNELGLPLARCGALSTRIAQKSEKFGAGNGGVAKSFIQAFRFLTSEKGPGLTTQQGLEIAEKLMDRGKEGANNFIQAFKYGVASQGLGMSHRDAIQFALKMALSAPETHSQDLATASVSKMK